MATPKRRRGPAPRKRKQTTSGARKGATKPPALGAPERAADAVLVARTRELVRAHESQAAGSKRAIGAHVLAEYFGDDDELALARNPRKARSYGLLVEQLDAETSWDERDLREALEAERRMANVGRLAGGVTKPSAPARRRSQ